MPNLDNFKANFKGGGARPNLFKVNVTFPTGTGGSTELASFMIKGASLPSSMITPIEVPFRGRKLKVAGDRTFEPWMITVINDTNMEIRNAFESWMNLVNANADNISAYSSADSLGYFADVEVIQLDRNEQETKRYKFIGAFPTNVSAIDLNFETNDMVEEFTVELNYQYWISLEANIG